MDSTDCKGRDANVSTVIGPCHSCDTHQQNGGDRMHRQPALAAVLVAKLIIAYAIARVEISAYGAGT